MAKIVVQKVSPITFSSDPFIIYDHRKSDSSYFFKYRANIVVNDSKAALSDVFEIRITRDSPYENRPNMFKNVSINSSENFTQAISKYDVTRAKLFRKKLQTLIKIPIQKQDIQKGFVDFEMKNPGSQDLFASIVKINGSVPIFGQVINFNSDPIAISYAMPRADFVIGSAPVFRNKTRIAITPNDKRITKFLVQTSDVVDNTGFKVVNTKTSSVVVDNDGVARFDVLNPIDFKKNIKISPVSFYKNVSSSAYLSTVLNDHLIYNDQCILYPIRHTGTTASFKISSIPTDVIFVKLLRRNVTKIQKTFQQVSQSPIQDTSVTLLDSSKARYDTFEYKVSLQFKDGTTKISAATYMLAPILLDTAINLRVNEVEQDPDDMPSIRKFEVQVDYNKTTSTQSLLNDLKTLNIDNIFPNEIKNLSTQLDPLVGVLVSKINLITCTEEAVGLFKPGMIKVNYEEDVNCVFIFEIVIKPAAEIIEDIASSRDFYTTGGAGSLGDPMTATRALGLTTFAKKQNFTQKFFNRNALYFGTLKYGKSLSSSQAGIESGRTGKFKTVLATPTYNTPKMQFLSVKKRVDDQVITWSATNLDDVINFSIYDSSDANNIKMISKSIVDLNRVNFSIAISSHVKKIIITAETKGENKVSIEAVI